MAEPVAIVGAGAGGLALALALTRRGLPAVVLERASALREGGGAIILWSNATKVLSELGVLDELIAGGRVVERGELRSWDGRLLASIPVAALAENVGTPSVVVWRGALLRALFSRLPAGMVEFDAGVNDFCETESGVEVQVQESWRLFSLLVGADGLHSRVRTLLVGEEKPYAAGQDAWVGVARGLSWSRSLDYTVGSLGRGLRFWHVPLNRTTAYWYGILDTRVVSAPPTNLTELKRLFRGWHDPIPAMIAATAPEDVIKTAIRDRVPLRNWGKGRVSLLGDAAHPVTPDLGQGACQALESAYALALTLAEHGATSAALAHYAQLRQSRAANVTRLSYLSSRTTMPLSPVLCGLRDVVMATAPKQAALVQLGWLFGLAEPPPATAAGR